MGHPGKGEERAVNVTSPSEEKSVKTLLCLPHSIKGKEKNNIRKYVPKSVEKR
jgi:hypothetical protein